MNEQTLVVPHLDVMLTLVPEIDLADTCAGCAFSIKDQYGYMQCTIPKDVDSAIMSACARTKSIWRPVMKDATTSRIQIKEVITALVELTGVDGEQLTQEDVDQLAINIENYLATRKDPEYVEYQRLKKKFE